jgi:hypothetical protein
VVRGGHSPRWAAQPQQAISRAGCRPRENNNNNNNKLGNYKKQSEANNNETPHYTESMHSYITVNQ